MMGISLVPPGETRVPAYGSDWLKLQTPPPVWRALAVIGPSGRASQRISKRRRCLEEATGISRRTYRLGSDEALVAGLVT